MSDFLSANMTDFADQSEDTQGAEEYEVADRTEETADEWYDETEDTENNDSEEYDEYDEDEEEADEQGRTKADAAFAEQRRRIAELEAEIAERDAAEAEQAREDEKNEQLYQALAFAQEQGFTDEEIEDLIAEIQDDQEKEDQMAELQSENDRLRDELLTQSIEQQVESDLIALRRIDPTLTDLDDLGEDYVRLRAIDMDPVRAYYAVKAADSYTKPQGAIPAGRLNRTSQESEYYTSEELDNLSKEEITRNWDKVQRSMDRLSKER